MFGLDHRFEGALLLVRDARWARARKEDSRVELVVCGCSFLLALQDRPERRDGRLHLRLACWKELKSVSDHNILQIIILEIIILEIIIVHILILQIIKL